MVKHWYTCCKEEREGKVDLRSTPTMNQSMHGGDTEDLVLCTDSQMQR